MKYIEITELYTGVKHYRKIKNENVSFTFGVEGQRLVVRDYYTREKLQSFNVSKYGSIRYLITNKKYYN